MAEPTHAVLGVVAVEDHEVVYESRWFRLRKSLQDKSYFDWTVDGVRLRDLAGYDASEIDSERTFLVLDDSERDDAIASLLALLAEPSIERGPNGRDPWVVFDDGRVGLRFCRLCGEMDCVTLSAEVSFVETTVTWRDTGLQVGYGDPWEIDGRGRSLPTFVFDRQQYTALIYDLLDRVGYPSRE
jgi:hypothetical protein